MRRNARPWLTLAEAAERAHRDESTIRKWAKPRKPGMKPRVRTWFPMGVRLFNRDDIDLAVRDTRGQGKSAEVPDVP